MEKRRKSRKVMRKGFGNNKARSAALIAIENERRELSKEAQTSPVAVNRQAEIDHRVAELAELESSIEKREESRAEQTGKIIQILDDRREQLAPTCSQLRATRDDLKRLRSEEKSITSSFEPRSKQESRLKLIREDIQALEGQEDKLRQNQDIEEQFREWADLEDLLGHLKPSYFYWLIAIECEEKDDDAANSGRQVDPKDRLYNVVYKYIGSNKAEIDAEHSHPIASVEGASGIDERMFRVGVAIRRRDLLEYLVTPGKYGAPFPYFRSVAGLALIFHQTIIMDRDRHKKFREKDNICPQEIEQDRGLDEVDYLSYISIPILNPHGDPAESGMGIVNIDTKLFVTHSKLPGDPVKACEGIFRTRLTPRQLTRFANNLYEQDDEDVEYIEHLTKIITPVLVLYAKCQVGAT
jgi:hypothetical protein